MVRPVTNTDIGLKTLVLPVLAAGVDIVAIHEVGAHPDDSWCAAVGDREAPQWVNWLADEDMLPYNVPTARILRYGYMSQWFGPTAVRLDMSALAVRLLLSLRRDRKGKEEMHRPLMFIAHGMGGLLVLRALLAAMEDNNDWPGIFTSTIGLVFFGTPFRGAEGFDYHEMMGAARREYHEDDIQGEWLLECAPLNVDLQNLVDRFRDTLLSQRHKIEIACFYEQGPSNVGRIVGKEDRLRLVVSKSSSCLEPSTSSGNYQLARDHFGLNKFARPYEEDFQIVSEVIVNMVKSASEIVQARLRYRGQDSNIVTTSTREDGFSRQANKSSADTRENELLNTGDHGWLKAIMPIKASRPLKLDKSQQSICNDQAEAHKWLRSESCMGMVNTFMGCYRRSPLQQKHMVKIAILDTGIDLDHPLLKKYRDNKQVAGIFCRDFVTKEDPIQDSTGHGTHCAHVILKICKTARIYAARVFESDEIDEHGSTRIIEAIRWAVQHQVDIVSMSFAFTRSDDKLRRAIVAAIGNGGMERDILFFAAASTNDQHYNSTPVGFPASMDQVIRVNSCKHNGRPSDFSPESDDRWENALSTIGEEIEAAYPPGKNDGATIKRLSGTSTSTAILVGVAALLIEFAKLQSLPKDVISNMEPRLHTSSGMKSVLYNCMAGKKPPQAPNYSYIRPWLLFTTEKSHQLVIHEINYALDKEL